MKAKDRATLETLLTLTQTVNYLAMLRAKGSKQHRLAYNNTLKDLKKTVKGLKAVK